MLNLSLLAIAAMQSLTLYISPSGNDSSPGTVAQPLATLTQAMVLVSHRSSNTIPATVILECGTYALSQNVYLNSYQSNVTIAGQPGARVVGCTFLKSWTSLGSDPFASTFLAAAQPNILEVNLNNQVSSSALSYLESAGSTLAMDIIEDGNPLAIAQYPAPGSWLTTSSGTSGNTLAWTSSVPNSWNNTGQIWMSGYPIYDYAYASAPLSSFNSQTGTASLPSSVTADPGSRFAFVNVPEELNGPGQYYLNRSTGILYFWPLSPSFGSLMISTCNQALFYLNGVANVTFTGFEFEGGLASSVYAQNSSGVNVENCRVNAVTATPLFYVNCSNSGVTNCTITACGGQAIYMTGGNTTTFAASGNQISNCTIENFGRLARQWPAVEVKGEAAVITHNLIEDGPYNAINLYGSDHQVTWNQIKDVDFEVSDEGAVYEGCQPLGRGLLVQNNWIQNVQLDIKVNPQTFAQNAGVYLDDMLPGATVEGNIIENGDRGVIMGGGRDNTVESNVFLGDNVGIQTDARGMNWAYPYATYGGSWDYLGSLAAALADNPLLVPHWPLIADALTNQPYFPVRFNANGNVYVGSTPFITYSLNITASNITQNGNVISTTPISLAAAMADVPNYTMPQLTQIGPQG